MTRIKKYIRPQIIRKAGDSKEFLAFFMQIIYLVFRKFIDL